SLFLRHGASSTVYTLLTSAVPLWGVLGLFVWPPARRLMHNLNPRPDPLDRQNATNAAGVSVPAKGDSAGSNPPHDPDATLVDFPRSNVNQDFDPGATFVDPDATFVDAFPPPRRSTG